MKRIFSVVAIAVGSLVLLTFGGIYGASVYYSSERGQGCASCHEMSSYVRTVHDSPHQTVGCMDCHDASLSTKLRHTWVHLTHTWPETIRLREIDVLRMAPNCQKCHQQEYSTWQAGPHSATYTQIFTNPTHNSERRPMEDCLRCHGMYFGGSIRDLVQPQNTSGPWHLMNAQLAGQPTMPCETCHWIHREGAPETKPTSRISVADAPLHDTLAYYDRRERMHFAANSLSIPQLYDGPLALHVSEDPRQGICYQCHAPRPPEAGSIAAANSWGEQAGSGDDRTPIGVHKGLSCFSCHNGHNENARASCKTCHPQMSHCGLDVEKMDTTYASAASKHNIHWVKCTDCHQHGVPKTKTPDQVKAQAPSTLSKTGL
jgi:hypothetical protein